MGKPIIVEHRLHQLVCQQCGTSTRATLPVDVHPSGYGVRVVAMVAVLSGLYRHSQRMVQSALADLFGISMSLGTVNKLRIEASDAVERAVEEAKIYVHNSPIVGADETSFAQGNVDGCNPKPQRVVGCSYTASDIFSDCTFTLFGCSPESTLVRTLAAF